MSPEIDKWLTRFAGGAGTQFTWEIDEAGFLVAWSNSSLPAFAVPMCPISAEATLETGTYYSRGESKNAAIQQGLSVSARNTLFDAADGEYVNDKVRARLLRICRIQERTQ